MRSRLFSALVLSVMNSAAASAAPVPAPARMPAQKAFDSVPQQPAQTCMSGALLSHTAYTGAFHHPLRCSELLSTDTLMRVRHWDRT